MADDKIAQAINNLASAISDSFFTDDGNLTSALYSISHQLKYLGNGSATTSMGAIEAFGKHIGEKIDALADAISSLGAMSD